MALGTNTIWMCRTTGSDTLNGGCFDPGQTAGMNTDGAATLATGNAPVFSSASYNFVAGDVGAWVYIASGSNWNPGWYPITSVAANVATLNATVGAASNVTRGLNGIAGVASVASPTGATWSIDYSRQDAAKFAYTDLATAGAGLTISSAANPFGKQHVGNGLVITGGANFTAGTYVIASVSGVTATLLGAANSSTGANAGTGTGGLGGALISLALAAAKKVVGNWAWIKSGTYAITTASTNVAGGCVSWANVSTGNSVFPDFILGFTNVPGDIGYSLVATRPLLQASGAITTFTLLTVAQQYANIFGIDVDAVSKSGGAGITINGAQQVLYACKASNCTTGISATGARSGFFFCEATNCTSTLGAIRNIVGGGVIVGCYSHDNTVTGILADVTGGAHIAYCTSVNNTGTTTDGIATRLGGNVVNCTAYGNGRHGFFDLGLTSTSAGANFISNVSVSNGSYGFSAVGTFVANLLLNNATYGNVVGGFSPQVPQAFGSVLLGTMPYVDPAGGNFALNNLTSGGVLCRAAGAVGVLPGLVNTRGYGDIGCFQHADPSVESVYSFIR